MSPHEAQLQAALTSGDEDQIWEAYKNAWANRENPKMDGETFSKIFSAPFNWGISREARKLLETSNAARKTLKEAARKILELPNNSRVSDVWIAALANEHDWSQEWQRKRRGALAGGRGNIAFNLTDTLISALGRQWARRNLPKIVQPLELLEEELDGIIRALDRGKCLTRNLLQRLSSHAEGLAVRLYRRGEISGDWLGQDEPTKTFKGLLPPRSIGAVRRVDDLLRTVSIEANWRDGGLRGGEIWRMSNSDFDTFLFSKLLNIDNVLRRLESRFSGENDQSKCSRLRPISEDLHLMIGSGGSNFNFLLIRLLHVRLILESPTLRTALSRPEDYLVPEVFRHLIGSESVTYVPELRLPREAERRWRARWAELTGEAISALFLERALDMDLTTLSRIPEEPGKLTPDFLARTREGEPIVYETKGATGWRTHQRQRKHALEQVGKRSTSGGEPPGWSSWAEDGRAFACSLFAATQGDDRSSLFHVEDPPFAFRHLFHEGWEDVSRRRHYAAVLEACEEYAGADRLLGRPVREQERREPERFFLPTGGREEGASFLGKLDRLDELARRLAHPRPEAFSRIRVFRGADARIYDMLVKGELPSVEDDGSGVEITAVGLVPGEEGESRGVYSRLSDGAFLAIVVE